MFSKILLRTDETTEDRPGTRAERVGGADRRSLPPPPFIAQFVQTTTGHWVTLGASAGFWTMCAGSCAGFDADFEGHSAFPHARPVLAAQEMEPT